MDVSGGLAVDDGVGCRRGRMCPLNPHWYVVRINFYTLVVISSPRTLSLETKDF